MNKEELEQQNAATPEELSPELRAQIKHKITRFIDEYYQQHGERPMRGTADSAFEHCLARFQTQHKLSMSPLLDIWRECVREFEIKRQRELAHELISTLSREKLTTEEQLVIRNKIAEWQQKYQHIFPDPNVFEAFQKRTDQLANEKIDSTIVDHDKES
jgi:DNA/RNA-binding domain of Phe-tRNA-synthetase-like protein